MQLQHMENLLVYEEEQCYAGGDQTWYEDEWQRCAGCGPTVLAVILCYEKWKREPVRLQDKAELFHVMKAIWEDTQPSRHGIPTTEALISRMQKVADHYAFQTQSEHLDVGKEPSKRPSEDDVYAFVCNGLRQDLPVAFLSLCKGTCKVIDDWHWVIVHSISETGRVRFCDEGKWQEDDLYAWLHTTTLGGGFVYFHIQNKILVASKNT